MRRIELFAAGVAAATAVLYLLIGFEVLYIGEPAEGGAGDILGFGLSSAGAFAVIAALLLFLRRRWAWIAIALFNVATIAMYFAVASVRDPPYEIWGLLIKALQVVLLGTVAYLVVRGRVGAAEGSERARTRVAHPA
jgi:hypothetical protein